jgi:hypothetical protein
LACVIFTRFFSLSTDFFDTQMTHAMTHEIQPLISKKNTIIIPDNCVVSTTISVSETTHNTYKKKPSEKKQLRRLLPPESKQGPSYRPFILH